MGSAKDFKKNAVIRTQKDEMYFIGDLFEKKNPNEKSLGIKEGIGYFDEDSLNSLTSLSKSFLSVRM